MGTIAAALFIGVVLAMFLIYILKLKSGGAITVTVFLCTGIAGSLLSFVKFMRGRKEKGDSDENQSIDA